MWLSLRCSRCDIGCWKGIFDVVMPEIFLGGMLNVLQTGRLTAQWIICGIDCSTTHDRLVFASSISPFVRMHPHGTVTVDHATVGTSRGGEWGQVRVDEPYGVDSKY